MTVGLNNGGAFRDKENSAVENQGLQMYPACDFFIFSLQKIIFTINKKCEIYCAPENQTLVNFAPFLPASSMKLP